LRGVGEVLEQLKFVGSGHHIKKSKLWGKGSLEHATRANAGMGSPLRLCNELNIRRANPMQTIDAIDAINNRLT
jgi:hypothetical protein